MTDENIQITTCSICTDIFLLLAGSYSFIIYYIYSYATISTELKYNYISNLLIAQIIFSILYSINSIICIVYKIKYNGKIISKKIWNLILPSNRFPFSILKLSIVGSLTVGNWICSIFVPIELSNCSIYPENSNVCYSMKIISALTLFTDAVIGLCIIIVALLILYAACHGVLTCSMLCQNCSGNNLKNQFIPKFITDRLQNYNPIPRFVSTDDDCAICLEKLNDNTENKKKNTLQCGHGYHSSCISEWFTSGSTTCPVCRFEVLNILEHIEIK